MKRSKVADHLHHAHAEAGSAILHNDWADLPFPVREHIHNALDELAKAQRELAEASTEPDSAVKYGLGFDPLADFPTINKGETK